MNWRIIIRVLMASVACALSSHSIYPESRAWYRLNDSDDNLIIEVSTKYLSFFTNKYFNGDIPATICCVNEEGCGYYRITSTRILDTIAKNTIKFNMTLCDSKPDSVEFKFTVPNYNKPFRIGLYYNGLSVLNSINGEARIKLKRRSSEYLSQHFSFDVYPNVYSAVLPNSTYAGITGCGFTNIIGYFSSKEYQINKNALVVECELLGITRDYFEQFYIKDEYVKIEDSKLIWRGLEFIKIKETF